MSDFKEDVSERLDKLEMAVFGKLNNKDGGDKPPQKDDGGDKPPQ